MFGVNLSPQNSEVLYHPRYEREAQRLREHFKDLKSHFILFSSGTTSSLKGYALSTQALETNARAVNEHFNLTKDDVWALSIPTYHVGGLSVLLRAKLLGNLVIDARSWQPESWCELLEREKVTITTIVPTQLYDLVSQNLRAPTHLKYVVVGGDFLAEELEVRALALGWPVIRTYGMSEVCSQLASAKSPASHEMGILPIHKVRVHETGRLLVKSESLFTLEFLIQESVTTKMASEFLDPDGYYPTQDRARLLGNVLYPEGRLDEQVKVSGHMVNFTTIKNDFAKFLLEEGIFGKAELVLESDARKGKRLVLLTTLENSVGGWERLKAKLFPVQIDETRVVQSFERTDLGKLKKPGPV